MSRLLDRYPHGPQDEHSSTSVGDAPWTERWWLTAIHVEVAAGLSMAFFTWGLAVPLAATCALGMMSWLVLLVFSDGMQHARASTQVSTAFVSGFSAMAVIGGVHLLHWLAGCLVIATLLTAPALWSRVGVARAARASKGVMGDLARPAGSETPPWTPRSGKSSDHHLEPRRAPGSFDATTLDDDQLCYAWRISFAHLRAAQSVVERAWLVQRRQEVLDELTRRHDAGVARWLASGARAASNPRRYLDPASAPHRHRS